VSAERRCLLVGADTAVTASVATAIEAAPGLAVVGVLDPASALSGLRPASDAVLACDGPGQSALEVASTLIRGGVETPVIVLSRSVDAATYRGALALGARGLLALPPDPRELRAAVVDASAAPVARETASRRSGRAVVVCAAKGGGGASSVALALTMAAGGLLVDLAGGFDDVAARLGCEPRRTLADVAGLDDGLGVEALRSLTLRHPSGLRLIARPPGPSTQTVVSPGLARALVREGRLAATLVALDTGVAGADVTAFVAQPADRVLVVTTPDQLSVDCASRAVMWLEGAGVPAQSIGLVVNRWSRWEDLTLRGIERRTGAPLLAVVRDGELAGTQPRPPSSLATLAAGLQET
jgi:pilus assembly protein CpaE